VRIEYPKNPSLLSEPQLLTPTRWQVIRDIISFNLSKESLPRCIKEYDSTSRDRLINEHTILFSIPRATLVYENLPEYRFFETGTAAGDNAILNVCVQVVDVRKILFALQLSDDRQGLALGSSLMHQNT
jgi:hypothetical protein